jgi:uncharacterized membrane protein (DUF373 family)
VAEKRTFRGYVLIAQQLHHVFELVILFVLGLAVVDSVYELIMLIRGGEHATSINTLQHVLLILVYVDLMRTVTTSLVEQRFRMDILLEAITIAVARDLIGALALIQESLDVVKIATLAGLLAVTTVLWFVAVGVERERNDRSKISS